ncbi:AB hydrolase-1 domain-containing protein [Candida albicans]
MGVFGRGAASRISIRSIHLRNTTNFVVPENYKPNRSLLKQLPWKAGLDIWWKSLSPNRLSDLQKDLVEFMLPSHLQENQRIIKEFKKTTIDDKGNYINEVGFKIINNKDKPTKHLVFIHGYGASLGCFARNFQIINKFKDTDYNYHVHFLDNLTFGLSSNPRVNNDTINYWRIPATAIVKLFDKTPTDSKKLYRKYYKLIEGYQLDPENFEKYRSYFTPILKDLENFYCSAIEKWRLNNDIESIDYLVGHSFGGYWCGSYALKYPENVNNLVLLSPVGIERHVQAVTNTDPISDRIEVPTLDPTSYKFLSRLPILSKKHILSWYYKLPHLPRLLPFLGPWGAQLYFKMWMGKLYKINKLIDKHGGAQAIFNSNNDLVYGSEKELTLIIEYLYNSITSGTNSDIYSRYLLTTATTSKWPLYDKFYQAVKEDPAKLKFKFHIMYGQFDFMNSEAGEKLVKLLNENKVGAKYYEISEGGHNLYIDNPFDTNQKIFEIVSQDATKANNNG